MSLDQFKLFVAAVREKAEGRWDEILPARARSIAHAFDKIGEQVECSHHPTGQKGGTPRNFRAFKNVALTGGVVCNTCGTFADGFSTLMWANGWDFKQAVYAVNDWLGGVTRLQTPEELAKVEADRQRKLEAHRKAQASEDARAKRSLNQVWTASVPLTHPAAGPARQYFINRGLTLQRYPMELRFHPSLSYKDDDGVYRGRFPSIVARFRTEGNQPGSIHRIYLTPDGNKLGLGNAKKLMSHPSSSVLSGGAIRLTGVSKILGVAEGIETALAAMQLDGINVWSCYSAQLLEGFTPPAGVDKVVIYADLDRSETGQKAAAKLAARLWEMGIMAGIRLPEGPIPTDAKGVDWLDALNANLALRRRKAA